MDWSDDVAYSVHDLEDAVHARQVDLHRLDHSAVIARASSYSNAAIPELETALAQLEGNDWWMGEYDGTISSQVALKRMTSELIARFCSAAIAATRGQWGDGPLTRYAANLEVPGLARAECALLKAITAHYVMDQESALIRQAEERDLLLAVVDALSKQPEQLDPAHRQMHDAAGDDAGRRRAVVDQVAALTDISARALADRLC